MRRCAVPISTRNPFTAVLLAGGRSTRMGRDKATLVIDGEPLWQRQLATLRALDPAELLISGPLDGPWSGAGVEVVPDDRPGFGPLGGLATILTRMRYERLLVLAVDLPAMTADFLRSLLGACPADRGIVPALDGRFEPLAAIYPRTLHGMVVRGLKGGGYSLQPLVALGLAEGLLAVHPVGEGDRCLFHNLNTPADFDGAS
jgi:molybdopterin-guanine dinucleotide biosynthesis protein A